MGVSEVAARVVATVGGAALLLRRMSGGTPAPAMGTAPTIPAGAPQNIPTLKMPTARGFAPGELPVAAPGLKVNAFATGLKHPRWMKVLPNGDVIAAESLTQPGHIRTPFDYAIYVTMKRAAAVGPSPNRLIRLRDADGDGVAESREVFLDGLNQPFGMELVGDTFYVGNTDGVFAFPFDHGKMAVTGGGKRLTTYKTGGHWTRSLLATKDGKRMFVGVGSQGNIDENGAAAEEGRAAIHEIDLETGTSRIFASGLRNPVGLAFEPETGKLWTVVNERDGLGDETPPDYLTSVTEGGFYGWPHSYWGQIVDDRAAANPAKVATALTPDFALGGHTASLGLCWLPEGVLPGFGKGMVIGQHGSWNRSTLSGYRVLFVPFENGKPAGPSRDILTGFLSDDEKFSRGRPVGVSIGPDGRSLLVADDVGDAIWRVTAA